MGEQLRFTVLGPLRAWRGPDEVDLGPPKQRAVLAVLLLGEGAQVSVETLVDAVRGAGSPGSAVSSLRTYVYRLRQLLGPRRSFPWVTATRCPSALTHVHAVPYPMCCGPVGEVLGELQHRHQRQLAR